MTLAFGIIFWLLVGLLVLVGLALVTPVLVTVRVNTSPRFAYRIDLRIFAGLAPRLTLSKGHGAKPAASASQVPSKRRVTMPKRIDGAVLRAVPHLIGGVLQRIQLAKLHIDADYGLGDPAGTGQLSGVLLPLQYATPLPRNISLDLRPDFDRALIEGSLIAVLRVTGATLLVPVARFAWRAYGPRK